MVIALQDLVFEMNENPLLNIVQELRSKELNSLDQLPSINKKLNMIVINCIYSFIKLCHHLEKTHIDYNQPDLSRLNNVQLNYLNNMLRDDIKVIEEFRKFIYHLYIQNNNSILTIYTDENNNLWEKLDFIEEVGKYVYSNQQTDNHPFKTETNKRSLEIYKFFSQIVISILGLNLAKSFIDNVDTINDKDRAILFLGTIDLDKEEISMRHSLSIIIDSIEKFIKIFSNHICITKIN